MRPVSESIGDDIRQRERVNHFLIRVGRRHRRRHRESRRSRVTTEHLVRPIDAGIDDRDIYAFTFQSTGIQIVELGQSGRLRLHDGGPHVSAVGNEKQDTEQGA